MLALAEFQFWPPEIQKAEQTVFAQFDAEYEDSKAKLPARIDAVRSQTKEALANYSYEKFLACDEAVAMLALPDVALHIPEWTDLNITQSNMATVP